MREARQEHRRTGKPARVFTEFFYRTRASWSRARRVVAKAEQIEGKENPRYVVTSLAPEQGPAQRLYEQLYCARGEMENRIKEQLSLFSDRLSTETLRANQLRLYFSSLAYVLVHALRRIGLRGTEWAEAQAETIRLKLLKIAARVRVTAAASGSATAAPTPGSTCSPRPGPHSAAEKTLFGLKPTARAVSKRRGVPAHRRVPALHNFTGHQQRPKHLPSPPATEIPRS